MDKHQHSSINPRATGAIFFAVFGLLFLIFAKYTVLSLKSSPAMPFLPSLGFTLFCGLLAGSLTGKWLSTPRRFLKSFLMGMLVALVVLMFLSLCLLIHAYFNAAIYVNQLQRWQDYFVLYGVIFLSMLFIIGIWLLPLTGLAATYFNKRFFPGLLAVEQLRSTSGKPPVKHDKHQSS